MKLLHTRKFHSTKKKAGSFQNINFMSIFFFFWLLERQILFVDCFDSDSMSSRKVCCSKYKQRSLVIWGRVYIRERQRFLDLQVLEGAEHEHMWTRCLCFCLENAECMLQKEEGFDPTTNTLCSGGKSGSLAHTHSFLLIPPMPLILSNRTKLAVNL